MKKKICMLLSGVLCLSLLGGCNSQTEETSLTPVRLNEVVHSVFYAPQYVAQELGFFEEEGLAVTIAVGNGADKCQLVITSPNAMFIPNVVPLASSMGSLAEKTAVFPSKGEMRKLVQGGGVSLNKEKLAAFDQVVTAADLLNDKYILAQQGKKKYFLIIVK